MTPSFIQIAIFSLTFCTVTSASLQNDTVSLLSFKSKADPNKKLRFIIKNTSTVCSWPGVQCQNNRNIVRLIFDDLNLTGVFPANTLTRMDQLRVLSLRNNSLTGPIPDLSGLVNLKILFLDHNYFTGFLPSSISSLHRLQKVDLSFNELSGEIPVKLCNLDRLNYIRLDSNRFNGAIPPFNQSSLEIFNVSVNFLSGLVPVTRALSRFGPEFFSINPQLCGEIVRAQCGNNSTTKPLLLSNSGGLSDKKTDNEVKNRKRIGMIVGFSIGSFLVISTVLCVMIRFKKSEKKRRKRIVTKHEMMELAEAADAAASVIRMEEENELEKKVRKLQMAAKKSGNLVFSTGEPRVYSVEQLMRASAELLGSGSMGTSYKAVLDNRVVVCVKRLDGSRLVGMTNEVFARHMEVVGRLRHVNLVTLGAYYMTKEEKILVYDYQPNGSLFSLIHGSKSTMAKPLHWTSCLKIAEDVAQGLSYLHQTHNLVHGNLKSSNILLGSDFEARISDYSLSSLFSNLPENEPTADSDIYSFGVILLELLTGKGSSDHPDLLPDDLVKWVKLSRDNGGGVEEKRLEMMTEVAIACKGRSPEVRPTMWEVIKMLQEIKEAAVMEDCGLN